MIQPEPLAMTTVRFRERPVTCEQLGTLVQEVVKQSTGARFIKQWSLIEGQDVVCFGQASATHPAAHLRIAPSGATLFFRPGQRYSKVKLMSCSWNEPAQPGVPRNAERAARAIGRVNPAPDLVVAAVTQFKLGLIQAYNTARDMRII